MAGSQLRPCVLILPSCYSDKMVVEIAELLVVPCPAVGMDQLCCRLPALRRLAKLWRHWELFYKILWSEYSLILS